MSLAAKIIGTLAGVFGIRKAGASSFTFGPSAGAAITTGTENICIGDLAGSGLTTGVGYVCIGYQAGKSHAATGNDDASVYIGYNAGRSITGGGGVYGNVGIGLSALGNAVAASSRNTAVGYGACIGGTAACDDNTCVGHTSGGGITSGDRNATFGYNAGITITTGADNTCIGTSSDVSTAAASFQTVIGKGAVGTANAEVTLGRVATDTLNMPKVSKIFNVATAGWGVPAVYASGAVDGTVNARSAAVATYTCGAADGVFEVSGNVNVTVATTHTFSLDVVYTDETNVSRTLILPVVQLGGAFATGGLITNTTGTGPYEAAVVTIRVKASTAITIRPSATGTYTTVTYNAYGAIKQIA